MLDYIARNNLVERSAAMGKIFLGKLQALSYLPMVGDIRGIGLMLAIEFTAGKATHEPYPAAVKYRRALPNIVSDTA